MGDIPRLHVPAQQDMPVPAHGSPSGMHCAASEAVSILGPELEPPAGPGVDAWQPIKNETNAIATKRDIVTSSVNICLLRSMSKDVRGVRARRPARIFASNNSS